MPSGYWIVKQRPTWQERFLTYIAKNEITGCWDWTGGKNSDGYGNFSINSKTVKAHRASYMLYKGLIQDGLKVRHKCRGKCVNPDHLELGTHADNMKDTIRDGTIPRGENHKFAKLTDDLVKLIRTEMPKDRTLQNYCKKKAIELGVSLSCMQSVTSGRSWTHVK